MIHLVYSLGIRTHDHKSPPITTAPLWLLLFRVFEFASRSNKKSTPFYHSTSHYVLYNVNCLPKASNVTFNGFEKMAEWTEQSSATP